MMKKSVFLLVMILLWPLCLSACAPFADAPEPSGEPAVSPSVPDEPVLDFKITPEQAREIMQSEPDAVVLDVRTQEEYDTGHIEGALLIPDTDVAGKAPELLPDKEATILVYCRSGRRSADAAKTLSDMGYTSVYDFGGIITWPYEIVTE